MLEQDIQEILFSEEQLKTRVAEIAREIERDYQGKEVMLISVLRGSFIFMADLCRAIDLPCTLDFMSVSSYGSGTTSSGQVQITKDLSGDISGKHILVVEDDPDINRLLCRILTDGGYDVRPAFSGSEAMLWAEKEGFDLVLLDIMLPQLSGMEVLRRLRRESQVPVIMLTARDSVMDKVSGLDSGADDYVTKPFAIEELLARIRAALRNQTGPGTGTCLSAGEVFMDVERHQVTVKGTPVELTKKEFDLLRHLLENKGRVLSREALLDAVWGFDFVGETNSVDVYIRFLRGKLDDAFGIKLIHTVRGVGYVIKED